MTTPSTKTFSVTTLIRAAFAQAAGLDVKEVQVKRGYRSLNIHNLRGRNYGDPRTRFYIEVTAYEKHSALPEAIESPFSRGYQRRYSGKGYYTIEFDDYELARLEKNGLP